MHFISWKIVDNCRRSQVFFQYLFSKYEDQWICSHVLKKSCKENFILVKHFLKRRKISDTFLKMFSKMFLLRIFKTSEQCLFYGMLFKKISNVQARSTLLQNRFRKQIWDFRGGCSFSKKSVKNLKRLVSANADNEEKFRL